MLINNEMYEILSESIFKLLESPKQQKYLFDRRKIKIPYESLIEQVSEKLFNIEYVNPTSTLASLNKPTPAIENENKKDNEIKIKIKDAFINMLEADNPLLDNSYTDKNLEILKFIKSKLLPFILLISEYDLLKQPNEKITSFNLYLRSLLNERK